MARPYLFCRKAKNDYICEPVLAGVYVIMEDKEPKLSYNQAFKELEAILAELRSDACDVDTLAERTRRAAFLLNECRSRLTRTESELEKVLADLDNAID